MKKTLNVTLAIEVDTKIKDVRDIVDNLSFNIEEDNECVSVKDSKVIDYFEVYF